LTTVTNPFHSSSGSISTHPGWGYRRDTCNKEAAVRISHVGRHWHNHVKVIIPVNLLSFTFEVQDPLILALLSYTWHLMEVVPTSTERMKVSCLQNPFLWVPIAQCAYSESLRLFESPWLCPNF